MSKDDDKDLTAKGDKDDLPAMAIVKLAQIGKSFDFLANPEEDIYTPEDGEPVED